MSILACARAAYLMYSSGLTFLSPVHAMSSMNPLPRAPLAASAQISRALFASASTVTVTIGPRRSNAGSVGSTFTSTTHPPASLTRRAASSASSFAASLMPRPPRRTPRRGG